MPQHTPRSPRNLGDVMREDFEAETGVRWRPGRWIAITLAALLAVTLVGWLFGLLTLPFRTAAGVSERIGNPDNVLFQYEHFHDLCAAVRTDDAQIQAKQDEIKAYDKRHPDGDPSDAYQAAPKRDRLGTELSGLKQHRAGLVETYNADSAKYNRALFKDNSLPDRLDESTPTCN